MLVKTTFLQYKKMEYFKKSHKKKRHEIKSVNIGSYLKKGKYTTNWKQCKL